MFSIKLRNSVASCFFIFTLTNATAQIKIGEHFRLTGNTSTQYTFYNTKGVNGGFGAPQRPTHYPQLISRLNLSYKSFSIPITLNLNPTIQFLGAINTPMEGPKSLNIFEYLAHPTNRIYANPKYKSFKFHLGHFVNQYSLLSSGDIKVFGVGADYSKGPNTIRIQRGIIQPRVANVAFNFNNGTYRRNLTAINITRKINKDLKVGLNGALSGDNLNTLEISPTANLPQKSATLSFTGNYKVDKNTQISGEIANSSWAPNALLADTLREFGLIM